MEHMRNLGQLRNNVCDSLFLHCLIHGKLASDLHNIYTCYIVGIMPPLVSMVNLVLVRTRNLVYMVDG